MSPRHLDKDSTTPGFPRVNNILSAAALFALLLPSCDTPRLPGPAVQTKPALKRPSASATPQGGHSTTRDQWDVVTARFQRVPGVVPGSDYSEIRIFDADWQSKRLSWPEETKLPLNEKNLATFTILTTWDFFEETGWYERSMIVKVRQEGMTLLDQSLCEKHGRRMVRKALPIAYGMPGDTVDGMPYQEWSAQFPHGKGYGSGICTVYPSSPKKRNEWVCAACVEAYQKWEAAYEAKHKN